MVNIDERVMTMKFDNSQFRRAAAETIGDLGRLRESVKMKGATSGLSKLSEPIKDLDKSIKTTNIKGGLKGISTAANQAFSEVERSANGVNLSGVNSEVEGIKTSFLSLGNIANVALGGLAAKGVEKALGGLKGLYDNTLGQIKTGGMARARNLEQANFMLGGIMESEAQVKQVMDAANASVVGTAYGLDQAAKAAAQFAASGVPIEQLQTSLTGIVGVAAMTSSEFDDISRIFTTVAGNGRVFATELNSIGARGINAAAALAKHFNVTEEEVRKMVSEGKVNFEDFSTAMATAFGPQAAKANDTYAGALSNVRAALSRIGADTAAVKLEGMRDVFNALRPIINGVHNALKPFIGILNNNLRAAFDSLVGPMTKVGDAFTAFFDPKQGPAFAGSLRPVIEFIQDIGQVAGLVSEVLKDMVAVIFGASPRFIEMSETTTKAGTTIQHIFRKLLSVIMLVPEIIGMIIKAFRGTEDSAGSAGMSILDFVDKISSFLYVTAELIRNSKVLNVVVGVLGGLFRVAAGGVAVFLKAISLITDGIVKLRNPMDVLKDIVEYAKSHFAGIFDGLRTDALEKFLNFVVNAFTTIRNAIGNISFGRIFKDFKIPRLNLKAFESLSKIFDNVRESISKVVTGLKEIDWSPITSLFSGDFTMPSFGDVKAIGSGIGNSIMGGVQNLSWDYVLEFAHNVRASFQELIAYLKSLDWNSIWTNVRASFANGTRNVLSGMSNLKDNVVKAGKVVAENLSKFGSWALDALKNVDWGAVGKGILDGLVLAVKMIAGGAALIAIGIGNLIKSAVESIDWGAALEGIKELGTKIKDSVTDMVDVFNGVEIEGPDITGGNYTGSLAYVQKAGETWRNVRDSVVGFFDSLKNGEVNFGRFNEVFGVEVAPIIESIISALQAGMGKIKDTFSDWSSIIGFVKDPIGSLFKSTEESITDGAEGVVSTAGIALMSMSESISDPLANIAESFKDIDVVGILNGIGVALGGVGFMKFGQGFEEFANSIASVPKSIAGVFDAVKENLTGLTEIAQMEAKGNMLLKLAISVGILAASLFALSRLSWGELAVGMAGIAGAMVTLAAGMFLLDKIAVDPAALNSIASVMLAMAVAVGVLTYSILMLGAAEMGHVVQGLLGLVGILLIVQKFMGNLATADVGKTAAQLMLLSVAIGLLTSSVMVLALIKPERLVSGVLSLIAMLLTLSVSMKIMDSVNIEGSAMQILLLASSVAILTAALVLLSFINWETLGKGALVLGAVLGAFTLMSFVSSKFNAGDDLALDLVKLATSILVLSAAMLVLQAVGWGGIVKGLAVLGGVLLGLVMYSKLVKTLDGDASFKNLALDLVKVSIAIAVLAAAMMLMQNIESYGIAAGLITLTVALWAISKASARMGDGGAKLGTQMLLVAGSLIGIALALKMFEGIDPLAAVLGIVAMGVAIGGLALAAKATEGMSAHLFALAGALVVASLAFAIVAVSLMGLSLVPWESIVVGFIAIIGVFAAFIGLSVLGAAAVPAITAMGVALMTLGGGLALAGLAMMLFAGSIAVFAGGIATLIALEATMGGVAMAVVTAIGGLATGILMAAPLLGAALAALVVALLMGVEQILVQGGPVILSVIWELGVIFVTAIGSLVVIVVAAILQLLVSISTLR